MHVSDKAGADTTTVPSDCRQWLSSIADMLIPASATMPAATAAGVAGDQLDLVLKARPDLLHHLIRGWSTTCGSSPSESLDDLRQLDPESYQAICLIVAGGYYTNTAVRELLGYTGQQPHVVQIADDIDEDLLMRVVERGPRYRPDSGE